MSLRKNSFFMTIGSLLRLFVSILSVPLLVRLMGLEHYGIWAVLMSLTLLGGLLEFGLTFAVTKHLSEDYALQNWVGVNKILTMSFLLITTLGLLAFIVLFVASPYLSSLLFQSSSNLGDVLITLKIMAGLLLLYFWQHWLTAVQGGMKRYDLQTVIETVSSLVMTIGILLIASNSNWLSWLAAWSVFVTICSVTAHTLVLKHLLSQHKIYFQISWKTAKILIKFGSTQWLSSLGSSLFGYADRIIVNYFLGPNVAGIYAATTSVVIKINQLSAMPLKVLPAWISAAKILSQQSRIQKIFIRATRLNGIVVFLVATPIMFWSQPLALFLVGPDHSIEAAQLLRLLSLVYGLYSLGAAGFYTAIGIGAPNVNATVGIVSGLLVVVALILFTPIIGLMGAVLANALYILVLLVNWKVKSLINLTTREYITHFMPSAIVLVIWWILSFVFDTSPGTIAVKVLMFFILAGISLIFVGGWEFLKEIVSMPVSVLKRRNS